MYVLLGKRADPVQKPDLHLSTAIISRVRSRGGTGLGLAIVKAIVEAHGGTVSLRSAAGRGTSFRITLPGLLPSGPETQAAARRAAPRRDDDARLGRRYGRK